MPRALVILCLLISALLAVAGAAAWVQSYYRPRVIALQSGPQHAWFLDSTRGRLVVIRQGFEDPLPPSITADLNKPRAYTLQRDGRPWLMSGKAPLYSEWRLGRRRLGFGAGSLGDHRTDAGLPPITHQQQEVMFPHWLIVALGLPLPLWWLWTHRRSRRWSQEGRCAACGYDLRESRDRCPECGRATAAAAP